MNAGKEVVINFGSVWSVLDRIMIKVSNSFNKYIGVRSVITLDKLVEHCIRRVTIFE